MISGLDIISGKDFIINDKITLRHPRISDVIDVGEQNYYNTLNALTYIPSDAKSFLWDKGIDWNNMSNIEMFALMTSRLPIEYSRLFFGYDLDFTEFRTFQSQDGSIGMINSKNHAIIDEVACAKISYALCKIHGIQKKPEYAGNKGTRDVLIDEDREEREINKSKPFKSILANQISFIVNKSGSYTYSSILELPYGAFMDAFQRLIIIDHAEHLRAGIYGGTIDPKKVKKKELDMTRSFSDN